MKLFHRQIGEGPPFVILHGLFGSSDNWLTIAKRFTEHFTVYLLDLRNHGKSPHSDIHDYPSMIEDLNEFITDHNLQESVIMGHSMGGKTVMKFAITYPEKVNKLIVVEMAPKLYKPKSKYLIEALLTLDLSKLTSREEADQFLAEKVKSKEIRQFLLKNLYRKDDLSFAWRLNLESLNKNLGTIGGYFTETDTFKKDTLFLQGENSNYITNEDYPEIKRIFVNSEIVKIPSAGHWVHIDQPEAVFEAINNFLLKKP
jgi:esterase